MLFCISYWSSRTILYMPITGKCHFPLITANIKIKHFSWKNTICKQEYFPFNSYMVINQQNTQIVQYVF